MEQFLLVMLGAIVSFIASYFAHRWEAKRAKSERLEGRQDAAVAALSEAFVRIECHLRSMPWEPDPPPKTGPDVIREEVREEYYLQAREWGTVLNDSLGPAKIAAYVVRNDELRERLLRTLELLENWEEIDRCTPIRRQWTFQAVTEHAVECMGAWRRGDPIPRETGAFTVAWKEWERSNQSEMRRMLRARLRNPDGLGPRSEASDE
ncbi:hypothetical protein [Streptomyces sclerotialus]|uniref:hypothetical protein n=1 Tax=Streptomyces sclerotialus TaxID=1957 RepID=UPI0004CB1716